MKTVNFQIEGRYIDEIYNGKKIEEYRSISEYNTKKLCEKVNKKDILSSDHYVTHFKESWRTRKDITHVRLFNGYKSERKELLVELKKIEIIKFMNKIPDGMKPGTICFVLTLGQIVVSKNFQSCQKQVQ
jgi:hypothetical protein